MNALLKEELQGKDTLIQPITGQGGSGNKRGGNRGGKSKGGFNKGESNHRCGLFFFLKVFIQEN